MRRALPLALLAICVLLTTNSLKAQNDRFAYAITDLTKDGSGWNALRKLDLQTGQYSDVLLNGTDQKLAVFDAVTKKQLAFQPDARYGTSLQAPFSTGVAAAAYDRKHNRLYYTPMFIDQLRYIDLSTMKVYYITDQPFTKLGTMNNDEAKIITRMAIAPDGYGYAITNDGNAFIRFSTGKKVRIEQLGALADDPSNATVSIHNRCSSFGGDMIADDMGNLFILSAPNHVFKVNIETKVATHLGVIKNLPASFTVNGAVVDAEGALLVSSALDNKSYYTINPSTWTATPYLTTNGLFKSSDLANSNFLCVEPQSGVTLIHPTENRFAKSISLYPNPVVTNRVMLQFSKVPAGDYTIQVTDILGRSVSQSRITINNENQTQELSLNRTSAKGIYLVKIADANKLSVFTQRVMVQ